MKFIKMEDNEIYKISGPALILAGPGTGKTWQLARRVKFLTEESNVDPSNIAIITFTSAAARNMHDRMSDRKRPETFVTPERQPELILTMHGLGFKIIRDAKALGVGGTTTVVTSDKLRNILIGDAAQLQGFERRACFETINCRQLGSCHEEDVPKCRICQQYKKILDACSAIDYDEQILLACKILKENQSLLDKYQSFCQHLLIDEYQDINAGQFELINLLSNGQAEGLFAVGDDDQSIYSWRGGSPHFIREFKKYFGSGAKLLNLKKSFRCHRHILESALAVVEKFDGKRIGKDTFEYVNPRGEKVKIHNMASDQKEAYHVRSLVEKAIPARKVLILIPHRGFLKTIGNEFKGVGIPFTSPFIVPGEGLPTIAILYNWLKDGSDNLSFRECIEMFIEKSGIIPSIKSRKAEKLKERDHELLKISNLWSNLIEKKSNNLAEVLLGIKDKNGLYSSINAAFTEIRMLYDKDVPSDFIKRVVELLVPWKENKQFLDEVNAWTQEMKSQSQEVPSVKIMTFQGAKGLEDDVVCIIGLEEGLLPRDGNEDEIAEQSRLMFVSMTRAKEELHLFHCRKRSSSIMYKAIYKKGEPPHLNRSRFIDVIPGEHVENEYRK